RFLTAAPSRPPTPLSASPSLSSSKGPAPTEIYTLSLHDALPISGLDLCEQDGQGLVQVRPVTTSRDTASTVCGTSRSSISPLVRSEEHTSELQSRFDLVCRLLLEKKNREGRHVRLHSHLRERDEL